MHNFSLMQFSPPLIDLTDMIINHWQHLVENPFIGQILEKLFIEHQFSDLVKQPETFVVNSYNELNKIVQFEVMLEDMVNTDQISQKDKDHIIQSFKQADANQEFSWQIGLVTVVGTLASSK